MSLRKYLETVANEIRKEQDLSRRETLQSYQRFIELAIAEEEKAKVVV